MKDRTRPIPLLDLQAELDRCRDNMRTLLRNAGEPGQCRSCKEPIVWMLHARNQKPTPYNLDGVIHFATCPNAQDYRASMALRKESDA